MKLLVVREKLINAFQYDFLNFLGKKLDVTLLVSKKFMDYSKKYQINFNLVGAKFTNLTPFLTKGSPLNLSFLKDTNILRNYDVFNIQELYSPLSYQVIKYSKREKKLSVCENHENIKYHVGYISPIYRNISKFNYNNSDFIVNFTKTAKKSLKILGKSREKNIVIYPGINRNIFHFKKKNYSNNIKFLFVGRLEEHKGIIDTLKSFSIISRIYDNVELTICGKGKLKYSVEKFSEKNRSIRYIGHIYDRNKLAKIYQESHIFVLPSKSKFLFFKLWEEQIGYVFLESMATGNCIISTNCGSIPEIIGDNFIVEQGRVDKLIEIMKYLVDNRRVIKEKCKYNLERSKKMFDIDMFVYNYLKVYNDNYVE